MVKIGKLKTTIGHIVLNTAMYFEHERSFTIIVNSKNEIQNIALYNILKLEYQRNNNAIYLIGSPYVFLYRVINKVCRSATWLSKILSNIEYIHHEVTFEPKYGSPYKFYNPHTFDNFGPFEIPESHILEFEKWKVLNNVKGKFVCVFVRDDAYWGESGDTRNSSIDNLESTIDYLLEKNYSVIRVGRSHNDHKNIIENKKYIDYSRSKNMSDVIDIMLIKECEFFISTNSGISNVQLLFDTKILLVNWMPIGLEPAFSNCQYILKRYIKNGKVVPYNSINKNILLCENPEVLENYGYTLEENSADEILKLVSDSMDNDIDISTSKKTQSFIVTKGRSVINKKWANKNAELF
jgi:putative glycosyltransferase (TIGR04372 family)